MKLLTPNEVDKEKTRLEMERVSRMRKLQKEESASVSRLNEALDKERIEKARINEDMTLSRDEGKAAVKKSVLLQEIKVLENQKAEALKPIFEKKEEYEALIVENQKVIKDLLNRKVAISESEVDLIERLENIIDIESDASEKSIKLDKRESVIKSAEDEVKKSTNNLSMKWVEFHKEVYKANEDITRGKKEIEDGRQTNENFKKSLYKKERVQTEHDRQIADRYATLDRTMGELKTGKR